ncbi:MAG: ABC transporter permease subunit [Spirochaetes bacterium]|nr:ABC transporter permease subunit [Spirochaetota bacterium]
MDKVMQVSISATRKGLTVPSYIMLLAPAVTFMLLMYAYPFLASIVRSFLDKSGAFSFENYLKTIDLYTKDIAFTFTVTIFNTVCTAVLAILIAVYFRIRQNRITTILSAIYKLPLFIPFVVVAQMMNSFLAPHGLLNVALAQLGLIDLKQPLQLFNFAGLSFGFLWKQVPFAVLIMHGGFQMIDNSYIEAARSAGAGMGKVITRVLIPMNKSSILVSLVLVYSQIVGTFTLPYMLIGGKIPTTITVDIAHRVNYFRDFGVANALGVFSYLLVLLTAWYYLKTKLGETK